LLEVLRRLPTPLTVTAVMRGLGVGGSRARRLMAEAGVHGADRRRGQAETAGDRRVEEKAGRKVTAGSDEGGRDSALGTTAEGGRLLHVIHGTPQPGEG
jgi:hypothetical protein